MFMILIRPDLSIFCFGLMHLIVQYKQSLPTTIQYQKKKFVFDFEYKYRINLNTQIFVYSLDEG